MPQSHNKQLFTIEQIARICEAQDHRVLYLLQRYEIAPAAEQHEGNRYGREVLDWIQAELRAIKGTAERLESERRAVQAYLLSGVPTDAGDPEMSDELRDDLIADSCLGSDENRARWAKLLAPPASVSKSLHHV